MYIYTISLDNLAPRIFRKVRIVVVVVVVAVSPTGSRAEFHFCQGRGGGGQKERKIERKKKKRTYVTRLPGTPRLYIITPRARIIMAGLSSFRAQNNKTPVDLSRSLPRDELSGGKYTRAAHRNAPGPADRTRRTARLALRRDNSRGTFVAPTTGRPPVVRIVPGLFAIRTFVSVSYFVMTASFTGGSPGDVSRTSRTSRRRCAS